MAHRAVFLGVSPVRNCCIASRHLDRLHGNFGPLTSHTLAKSAVGTKKHSRQLANMQTVEAAAVQSGAADVVDKDWEAFDHHQANAARLDFAEEARTLLDIVRVGTLSTIASDGAASGFPSGSVVEYAPDEKGRPIFMLSSISPHTKHLRQDSRCSFTVLAPAFRDLADARVSLTGHAKAMPEERQDAVRSLYKRKNVDSFWADFGDFKPFYMEDIVAVHFNGGFGRAGRKVTPEQLMSTAPDPIAPFAGHVVRHMNEDHKDSLIAMVKHFTGLTVDQTLLVALDRLGMDCICLKDKERVKCRLPYTRPVSTRGELKDVIVEMSKQAQVGQLSVAQATQVMSEI